MANDRIQVKVDGADREIYMSFGLLNELAALVGDIDGVPTLFFSAETRAAALRALLAERKPSGKIVSKVEDILDVELTVEDAENLLNWVADHLTGFFVRSMEKVAKVTESYMDKVTKLASSLRGREASASPTP